MLFVTPNQQCQSTEGHSTDAKLHNILNKKELPQKDNRLKGHNYTYSEYKSVYSLTFRVTTSPAVWTKWNGVVADKSRTRVDFIAGEGSLR